jgi:uncharacterized protein YndB with AHSA1/START domain
MSALPETAEVSLPSDSEVSVRRAFRARRDLVYRAYTTPEWVRLWLTGLPGWTMPVCEMDVRVGGKFRWRWRADEDGKEFGFQGEFLEVEAPRRIRNTEAFDPGDVGGSMGDRPAMVTVTFDELAGVTIMTTLIDYGSKASRDQALATGMTNGMEMSYASLDRLLSEQEDGGTQLQGDE